MERLRQKRGRRNRIANPPKAIGEVRYTGLQDAKAEYDLFQSALGALRQKPAETFMTAASPGIIATTMVNEYYDSYETYVFALARELRKEYELILPTAFFLQLDAPDFGLERARMFKDKTDAEFLQAMELNVEAINRATEGIPANASGCTSAGATGKARTHTISRSRGCCPCSIAPRSARSASSSPIHGTSTSTRRSQDPLPPEMILIPGVIDTTTNFVEHPEVVANRICEAVQTVGDRSRVMPATDCGFGTSAGTKRCRPT